MAGQMLEVCVVRVARELRAFESRATSQCRAIPAVSRSSPAARLVRNRSQESRAVDVAGVYGDRQIQRAA